MTEILFIEAIQENALLLIYFSILGIIGCLGCVVFGFLIGLCKNKGGNL
jgi:hypothetical protein